MKELVEFIVQRLVDSPEEVSVKEIVGNRTDVLELHVSRPDIGKVIGRHGRTAGALRTIIQAASAKRKKRAVLEIIE
jgi:predicted RNA-binding protein YlqC (UPF0109 family)